MSVTKAQRDAMMTEVRRISPTAWAEWVETFNQNYDSTKNVVIELQIDTAVPQGGPDWTFVEYQPPGFVVQEEGYEGEPVPLPLQLLEISSQRYELAIILRAISYSADYNNDALETINDLVRGLLSRDSRDALRAVGFATMDISATLTRSEQICEGVAVTVWESRWTANNVWTQDISSVYDVGYFTQNDPLTAEGDLSAL